MKTMAKGEKPAYRLMIVRQNADGLLDENGKPLEVEAENGVFLNLCGLWPKQKEGQYSGAFKPSIKTKDGYVTLSELTIKNGEFVNLMFVKE